MHATCHLKILFFCGRCQSGTLHTHSAASAKGPRAMTIGKQTSATPVRTEETSGRYSPSARRASYCVTSPCSGPQTMPQPTHIRQNPRDSSSALDAPKGPYGPSVTSSSSKKSALKPAHDPLDSTATECLPSGTPVQTVLSLSRSPDPAFLDNNFVT